MKIRAFGDRALFTQPETMAEPCTYPAMTPTAAKGFLESIFWKPEMRYKINCVMVLNPIQTQTIKINSVKDKLTPYSIKNGFVASEHRAQRYYTYLVNVDYVIDFDVELTERANAPVAKYINQITTRINQGQCFRQPYFGMKEFVAYFDWATGDEQPADSLKICKIDMGYMPLYIEHENNCQRDLKHVIIDQGIIHYARD